MTGVELVLFASLIGWLMQGDPIPAPCYVTEVVNERLVIKPEVCSVIYGE